MAHMVLACRLKSGFIHRINNERLESRQKRISLAKSASTLATLHSGKTGSAPLEGIMRMRVIRSYIGVLERAI